MKFLREDPPVTIITHKGVALVMRYEVFCFYFGFSSGHSPFCAA